MFKKTEVLAPVGGKETLIAAVRTGADAVYFGAQEFNARRNAENFSDQELCDAIKYLKLNNVKSYLTLNTLIKDNELQSALELTAKVKNYGINAVIVQDLGLAKLLHEKFPDLILHASTQLSVHSAAALPLLKEMGFSRVVPAREMTKTELIEFCKKAKSLNIEVEVFIHGALCMCLSGQCYFSAYLGGRSANRGLCAGTCRLPFNAKGGTGYDLSLKDLSLIPYLNELTEMGVTSFKIEGRMKRPEYVASAVTAVRQMIDNGYVEPEINRLLEQVFSRDGFTDGYFTENFGKNMFGIRSEQDKLLTNEAISKIHGLYRNERQKIPLNLNFNMSADTPTQLTVSAEGKTVTILGDVPQIAINRPLTSAKAEEAFSKLGGTCYYLNKFSADLEDGLMLPISSLNNLRKNAIEKLNESRIGDISKINPAELSFKSRSTPRNIKGFFARFATIEQLLFAEEQLSSLVGYSLPAKVLVSAIQKYKNTKYQNIFEKAFAEIPRGASDDNSTNQLLKKLKENNINHVVCSNISAVNNALNQGFEILGGFGLNIFNSNSIDVMKELGIKNTVISTELSINEIATLNANDDVSLFCMCYGRQPLMLTRNCPVKNGIGCKDKKDFCIITDRKNQKFPVICENGFSEILNCKITDISDSINRLNSDFGYLYFTLEKENQVTEVINTFLNSASNYGSDYTRGLFKSGVL